MSQPPPAQITIKPPLAFRMMYPYMMNQSMGQSRGQSLGQGMGPGMGQGYPVMPMPMGFNQMMGTPSSATPYLPQEGELKAFDSSQMKRGRNGHYGYLEGRGEPYPDQVDEQNLLVRPSASFQLVCNHNVRRSHRLLPHSLPLIHQPLTSPLPMPRPPRPPPTYTRLLLVRGRSARPGVTKASPRLPVTTDVS